MDVFEYYLEKNRTDPAWVKNYQSTSDKQNGKLFSHTNTNCKAGAIRSVAEVFTKFIEYNNRPRDKWVTYETTGQQKAKQYTVRMQKSKLFKKCGDKYTLTAKGLAYCDLLKLCDIGEINQIEYWILTYYFLYNSYFELIPNYIPNRVNEILTELKNNGIETSEYISSVEKFLADHFSGKVNKYNMPYYDAYWYQNFYNEKDFLFLYRKATRTEKEALANYVSNEIRNGETSQDCIGHKCFDAMSPNMIIDESRILYVTHELSLKNNLDAVKFGENIAAIFERFVEVSRKVIIKFVEKHHDVFDTIFNESVLCKTVVDDIEYSDNDSDLEPKAASEEKQDDTTSANRSAIRNTSMVLKRMAKDRANNKCELDPINSCKYFTSKENQKNYLEVHHLIPFEFSNEFEASIEILDNYVALCPNCHMLLHHGADRERKGAIAYLFHQREEGLKAHGIDIKLETLFKYYQIED